ncbi:hypothetical protein [Aeoliella sp. SH292]|uniref:hypothetical protein n=1 Tax=Aeoliella sp. SH292 TaxID=3454464 RepID=UPI003F955CC8
MTRTRTSHLSALCIALFVMASAAVRGEEIAAATTVGVPATIEDHVLPGPELEVKPLADRDAPFVLRIVETYPHGESHRYTLEYYALEPGSYNLIDYLQPKDAQPAVVLPAIPVNVEAALPPGQVEPNALKPSALPSVGGYRIWLTVGVLVWVVGAYVLLFVGRKPDPELEAVANARPQSLADRLRPTIEAAIAGKVSHAELAELERGLFGYWRTRLGLNALPTNEALREVLKHPDGGQLLRQLEVWLHDPSRSEQVDVSELLEPYRNLPSDALQPLQPAEVAR